MSNIIVYSPENTIIETKEDLITAISSYFSTCQEQNTPLTVSGLGLFLGLSRYQLKNFPTNHTFYPEIRKALQYIEDFCEQQLHAPKPPTGVMFALKNNFDWQDKQEIQISKSKTMAEIIDELNTNNQSPITYEGEVVDESTPPTQECPQSPGSLTLLQETQP